MSPWTAISPGQYQRKMGENEALIRFIGDGAQKIGREHWSVTASATFQHSGSISGPGANSEPELERLRKAWIELRLQHPSIATVAENASLTYSALDADGLRRWSEETFFLVPVGDNANDVVAALQPSPNVTCHYLPPGHLHLHPHSSQIIMHSSHWRTDGYGMLQLVGAFLDALVKEPPRRDPLDEHQRLTLSVEDVLQLPVEASPAIQEAAARYLATGALAMEAIGVDYEGQGARDDEGPAGTRAERLCISPARSKMVFESCALLDLSHLAAVHAALAAVNHAFAPRAAQDRHYTSTMRFSLRPYLPEPYNTAAHAAALYTGGYLLKVNPSASFMENARKYDAEYQRGLSPEFLQARRHYAAITLDHFQHSPIVTSPRSEIDISSVGDAELLVKSLHSGSGGQVDVLDVSLSVETLTRQMYLFYWEFRGSINFHLAYNEAFYEVDYIRRILQSLEKVLEEELDTACRTKL